MKQSLLMLLVRCVYITIQLSKVRVSVIISIINKVLVKDRVSYALHIRDNNYANEVTVGSRK